MRFIVPALLLSSSTGNAKTPLGKEMQQWGDITKNLQQGEANWLNSSSVIRTPLCTSM